MLPFLRNRGALLRWVLSALSQTAVVVPWMLLFYASEGGSDWPAALPGAWLLILTYLVAGLWEAGSRSDDPRRRIYALAGGVALAYLVAYQAVPDEMRAGILRWNKAFFFVPVAAYLWYQGARGALEGIEYGRIFSSFSTQFLSLLGGIILLMLSGHAADPAVQVLLYWSVVLLFAAGLSLLLITRERSLKADQAKMGEQEAGGGATPLMTSIVLGLVGLTIGASSLLSVERLIALLRAIGEFVSPLANWLWSVAMLIVVRWVALLTPLFNLIRRMVQQQEVPPQESSDAPAQEDPYDFGEVGPGFDWTPYLKAALLIGALILLASWLYRLNRRRLEVREDEEERVSLGFWKSLWADLKSLFGLLGRKAAPVVERVSTAVLGENAQDARALFRRLQAWGAASGRPRRDSETPNRYRDALTELYPGAEQPAGAVTAVYNQARYGKTAPTDEAVDTARAALEKLERGPA
ncbi:MAG: DUF4129 domain-containing protein [Bacillota bacterium]